MLVLDCLPFFLSECVVSYIFWLFFVGGLTLKLLWR